jgi:sulfite exporter TauE/SafE
MSHGLLLLVGFLSSFHCVGMCGPLILGYTAKTATNGHKTHHQHLLYGIGKTLSYTSIATLFGAFGSIIAFTPYTQGAVGIVAGLFLFLFGLHMLNVFPALNHFQIKPTAFLTRFKRVIFLPCKEAYNLKLFYSLCACAHDLGSC